MSQFNEILKNLDRYSLKELQGICRKLGIWPISNKRKQQLQTLIRAHIKQNSQGGGESKQRPKSPKTKTVKKTKGKRKPPVKKPRNSWNQIKGKSAREMRQELEKWTLKDLKTSSRSGPKSPCYELKQKHGVQVKGKSCSKLKSTDRPALVDALVDNFSKSPPTGGGGESKQRPESPKKVEVGESDRARFTEAIRKCLYGDNVTGGGGI